MRQVVELLRLHAEGLSVRQLAESLGLPRSTVADYLARAVYAGVAWPLAEGTDEAGVLARLFGPTERPAPRRPTSDWAQVHAERKRPGVTLQLLWLEYKQIHPDGYQYTQFCAHYQRWRAQLDPVLRQVHPAGEKVFVDYAGQTMPVVDPATGEIRAAQIFVGTLGASHYIYAEATWTQALPDWIGAHVRMYTDFGGVPALTVPDNLRSGVTHACCYEPILNPTYQDLAAHYRTAILPTRVARPRDKAKVETGVQLVERWCLAPLRQHTFFSLAELNAGLRGQRDALNARPFQKLAGTRRQLLETLDRPALKPLPPTPYEYAEWRKARVNIDYHVQVDHQLYSVPHPLVRQEVEVRLTATTVEVLHHGKRVAAHARSAVRGHFTTDPGHRPKAHQQHLEWTPSRLIRWGTSIGAHAGQAVQQMLESLPHPEQGYRSCLSGSCAWRVAMARPAWTRPVAGRSPAGPRGIGRSSPFWSTASIGSGWPRPRRPSPCRPRTRMSAAPPTTPPSPPRQETRMLFQQTIDRLHELRLTGMAQALDDQRGQPDLHTLAFEDRFGLLLEREVTARGDRRLTRLLQLAKLRLAATLEDLDFQATRGLDRSVLLRLAGSDWIRQHQVVLLVGATDLATYCITSLCR